MKHIHHILYCLLFIAGLSSCITDTDYDNYCPGDGKTDADKAQVMLSLSIPNSQFPSATRSISDDSKINSLYVLVFEGEKEDYDTNLKNYKLTDAIDITGKYTAKKRFYVAIKESKKAVCLSLVANVEAGKISTIKNSLDATPLTREATLKSLTFENASNLSYMPMYGEADVFMDGLSREVGNDVTVNMVRALAKIEVQNQSTQLTKDFELLDIEVLNTNAKGYIAAGQGDMEQERVQSVAAAPVTIEGIPTASVYVAETTNNNPSKISVLLHANFKGEACYYRLDMIKDDETENAEIPELIRNYKYIFSLQNVQSVGYTSRDEAINGSPSNGVIKARMMLLSAEESDILDITTDDYYFLGVNSSTLQLDSYTDASEGFFTKLKILTNNEAGWKIVDYPEEGVRFTIAATDGSTDGTAGGTFSSGEARKVISVWVSTKTNEDFNFYITSGKIRKTITVKAKP